MTRPAVPEDSCSGPEFLRMMAAATRWLESNAAAVNALNVYPVPDGDTGTNMVLTLRTALREAEKEASDATGLAAKALAQGALLGARGNSGVILSQYLQGLARGMDGLQRLDSTALAKSLAEAAKSAYAAMSAPVEGTILTVARAAGEAAVEVSRQPGQSMLDVLESAATAAQVALDRTPEMLPVLKEAGVVDAGGQGLVLLLRAAADFRAGRSFGPLIDTVVPVTMNQEWLDQQREASWGFCTEFILREPRLHVADLRRELAAFGDSESIVEGDRIVRVHLHTAAPENVLGRVGALGVLEQVSVRDMDQQHRQFLSTHQQGVEAPRCGVVAVASGAGFVRVFRSLGAGAVIWGGQTMNPSAEEIAEAVDSLPAAEVIVLPNNKNIVPTARLAQGLVSKRLHVVPSVSLPQGISCLLAYNSSEESSANVARMDEALQRLRWAEVTRASRSGRTGALTFKEGQTIGLLEGDLVIAAAEPRDVVCDLVRRMSPTTGALLTVYYGAEVAEPEAARIGQEVRRTFPGVEVEVVEGGQSHYPFILSLE